MSPWPFVLGLLFVLIVCGLSYMIPTYKVEYMPADAEIEWSTPWGDELYVCMDGDCVVYRREEK